MTSDRVTSPDPTPIPAYGPHQRRHDPEGSTWPYCAADDAPWPCETASAFAAGLAAGRTAAAEEAEDRANDVVVATRQMFNDANTRLRSLILAALGIEDDGRTALVEYVHRLIADRENALARGRTAAAADIRAEVDSTRAIEGGPDLMRWAAEIAEGCGAARVAENGADQ